MTTSTLFGQPSSPATLRSDAEQITLGVEFSLSEDAGAAAVWFYSPSGAGALPTSIGIYKVSDTSLVHSETPSWSGVAGSGWIRAEFAYKPALSASTNYKACVFNSDGSSNTYGLTSNYWSTGAGASGVTNGILSAPNASGASPGQSSFNSGSSLAYPGTASGSSGNYWVDIEVVAGEPYVVQSFTLNDGSYSGAFDNPVSEHNTIVMVVTDHNTTPATLGIPVYDGSEVDGATKIVWASEVEPPDDTAYTNAVTMIWLLPDVPTSGTTLSIPHGTTSFYTGIFAYEIANLGSSPVVVQFNKAGAGDGVDQGVNATDTSAAAGNVVFASLVQDGTADSYFPPGSPWVSTGLSGDSGYNSVASYQVTTEAGQTLDYTGAGDGGANWSAVIAEIAPGDGDVSASGAISLKKMVLSGASAEKSSASGAIKLKKMVLSGSGSASEIVVTFLGNTTGELDIAPDVGDTVLIFVSMYDVTTGHSSDPTNDGTVVSDAVQVWEVQDSGSGHDMYSSCWMLPNVQSSSTNIAISSSGGSYPSPDGTFAFLGIKGLGSSPILDRVITAHANNGDSDIGPTSAIRHAQEVIVAQSAIYGSYADDGPGSPWTSPVIGTAKHGVLSYQTTDTSGGTYSWSEAGNNNAWAGGIATIAVTEDSVSISGAISLKKMSVAAAVNAPSGLFNLFSNINMSGLACSPDANGYTLGTEFEVTTDGCSLKGVRFFSASGAIELPQQIGLYNVSGETLIQSQDASWDGDPATGWVTALFDTPIVLDPTAKYVLTAMQTEDVIWYTSGNHFWDTGLGSSGITNGPLSAPNLSASAGGQGLYDYASIPDMGFPASTYQGSTYWVDPVVDGPGTPSSPSESSVLSIFGGNLPDISVSAANDSPYNIGIQFIVTEDGCELAGYSWYVPDDGDVNGSDYDFALYTTTDGASGTIVDGSTVTGSGTWLTGTWNYTELETPVPLSTGVTYVAVGEIISVSGNTYQAVPDFWDTGAGASGIIAGPLTAPEASTAVGGYQQPYATSHVFPTLSYENSWYGIDVGVTQSSGVSASGAITLKKMVVAGSTRQTFFKPVGDSIFENSSSFFLAPSDIGDLLFLMVRNAGDTSVWCTGVSSENVTWEQLGDPYVGVNYDGTIVAFAGKVTDETSQTVTVAFNGSPDGIYIVGQEFASSTGEWVLDDISVLDVAGTDTWPSFTPDGPGELYVGYVRNFDDSIPGSTPGYFYNDNVDGAGNGLAYNTCCDASTQAPVWADSGQNFGVAVLMKAISGVSISGAISLKKMVLSGASAEKAVVTGAIKLKKMVLSGASAEKAVITGAVKLKKMVLAGVSHEKAVITGAVKLKKMVLAGVSHEKAVITGAVKLKKMVLTGSSTKTVSASGAISLKKMVISGTSHEKAVITGSVKLKKMVIAASGTEKPAITGVIKLKKFVISGASHEKAVITGTITLKKMRVHGEEAKRKASTLFVFWPL